MIYRLIPDSSWYLTFPISLRHPLPQLFHSTFGNLGTFGMELAAFVQISLILLATAAFVGKLRFKDVLLNDITFVVVASPCLLWGRQIGSDALGYAFMLLAMANIDNVKRLVGFTILAVLCRHQYLFLFLALLLNRENWIYFPLCGLIFGYLVLSCHTPNGNMSTMYAACVDWEKKPDGMSHFDYFNYYCGGNRDKVPLISPTCTDTKKVYWTHKKQLLKLWGSSVYDNFRFSQLAFLFLLLLAPVAIVKRVALLNCAHYSLVIFSSSLYFQQYTLMIELTMIAATIKLYDHMRYKREPV